MRLDQCDNDQLAKKSPHSVQETAAKKRARAVTFSHHARSAFSAKKMEIKTKTLDSNAMQCRISFFAER